MINDMIAYVRREVATYLGIQNAEVIPGHIHVLKDDQARRALYISLVNLAEESTLRNTGHTVRRNNHVHYQEPPVYLNLFVLFAANFDDYDMSLLRLSQTIELFQSKRVFDASSASPGIQFPATLEQLVFDFYNLSFEQLNHLWGVLGGAYLPSALYKVRLVKVQRDVTVAGPEIKKIEVDTRLS